PGTIRPGRVPARRPASTRSARCSSAAAMAWNGSLPGKCAGSDRPGSSLTRRLQPMLLAIDVGNTNIVLGVFERSELVRSWRLQTVRERTSDELALQLEGLLAHARIVHRRITGIVLGSVVPPLTTTM